MDRKVCRKSLAGTLAYYAEIFNLNEHMLPELRMLNTEHIADYNISLISAQIAAVKEFARNIGLIDYAENYDLSTEQLITKIESEENENENRT